jgi:hypothetical protein
MLQRYDEYLAPTAFAAPAIPTDFPNNLQDLQNIAGTRAHEIQEAAMDTAAPNPRQRVQSGFQMGYYDVDGSYPKSQYNPESSVSHPASVGTGQALCHPQDQTMSGSKDSPRGYQGQEAQYNPSHGSNPNLSYEMNKSSQRHWAHPQTSQYNTDPWQLDRLSSMASRSMIQDPYSTHSGSHTVQQGGVHGASTLTPEQRLVQIETFRQHQARIGGKQTQPPGRMGSSQNSLAQVMDPSLGSHSVMHPAQYPQLLEYYRSPQRSPGANHPLPGLPNNNMIHLSPYHQSRGIAQGPQQSTRAIRPSPNLNMMHPSHYHQAQGYESNQQHVSGMILPQPKHSPLLSDHQMQATGPVPPPANGPAQVKNQTLQNLHRKPSSPNKPSPLNQAHHQITNVPKPSNASPSSSNQSSQQSRIPDITLHKPSKYGKGSLKIHDDFVFPGLLDETGWNVLFGEKVSPPPGSVVHELYNPQLRFDANGIPFTGEALNESEFNPKVDNAGAVTSAPLDDVDTLLAFESPRQVIIVHPNQRETDFSRPDNTVTKSAETHFPRSTIRQSPHPAKQPSSLPHKKNKPSINPSSLLSQISAPASTATASETERAPGQQCKVTAAPYIPRLNNGSLPPRGATMGTLTLPTTPAQPIQPLKHIPQQSYVPQAGFRSRPSMGPKAKKSKLQTEPIPQSEPKYVMNHAKTGIITESASLNNIPGYKENMAAELARTRKEIERRFKEETEQWEADRRQEQLEKESRAQSTSYTPSLIPTNSLSSEVSTTLITPHSPKTQSNKRKLDEITPSDNIEAESAKKIKPSIGIQGAQNQNQQQIAPNNTSVESATSVTSHKHADIPSSAVSTTLPTLHTNTQPNKNKCKLHDLFDTIEEDITKKARLEIPSPWNLENLEFDRGRPEDPFWLNLPEFSGDGFPLDWFEDDARLGGDKSGSE